MTPRARANLVLFLLLVLCVAVPAVIVANYVGGQVEADQRIGKLEQRVTQLETDVSLLRE